MGKETQMAVSTCHKCGGHSFELTPFTPIGESRKLMLVQCSACGAAVGALDPVIGPQTEALKGHVTAIDQKLARIAEALQELR
jgi:flavoprotein